MTWQSSVRVVANWIIPLVLIATYLHAMFIDPTQFVGDQSPTEPGSIPKETWAAMSPTAKGLGPQLGGWAICYAIVVAGFLFFEPNERTHQLMSRINAFVMLVWWQIVWYVAMLPNKDYSPMTAKTYFNDMSFGEIILGLIYVYCGWFVKTPEADKCRKD